MAQATLGASLQKAALRLAGAVIGGGIGLLTIVVLMPVMTGLASLVVVTAVVMALAGWIIAGGQRTSYAGIQIGFAFALSVLNDLGPTTDLTQARDRVMGVLLGILISLLTFQWTGVRLRRSRHAPFTRFRLRFDVRPCARGTVRGTVIHGGKTGSGMALAGVPGSFEHAAPP